MSDDSPTSALLTVRQVADRLRVSTAWVYRHIEAGELAHVRQASRVRVPEHTVAAYIERFAGLRATPAPLTRPVVARRKGVAR